MATWTLDFEVEWFEHTADRSHLMFLRVYLADNTIELFENKKCFLKKILFPLQLNELVIGGTIMIFGRLYSVKAYANSATQIYMKSREIHFLCSIPQSNLNRIGEVLSIAKLSGLKAGKIRTTSSPIDAYPLELTISSGSTLIDFLGLHGTTGRDFLTHITQFRGLLEVVECDSAQVLQLMNQSTSFPSLPSPSRSTLCIIKPHILKSQRMDEVLRTVCDSGFSLRALASLHLNIAMAEELLDVYQSVYPSYNAMINHMISGPLLAVLVEGGSRTVSDFRGLCGPLHPEIAQTIRPRSLRAMFGETIVENAIHCSDLEEDADQECEFIFKTLTKL